MGFRPQALALGLSLMGFSPWAGLGLGFAHYGLWPMLRTRRPSYRSGSAIPLSGLVLSACVHMLDPLKRLYSCRSEGIIINLIILGNVRATMI